MKKLLNRFILLILLTTFSLFSCLVLIIGEPTEETWRFLLQTTAWNEYPTYVNLLLISVVMAFIITCWMSLISRKRDQLAVKQIQSLKEVTPPPVKAKGVPKNLSRSIFETYQLIEQQRHILQKQTNEKVVANDTIVQERLVIERQRLARELHDSVSQQLFAASMMLSALTEQQTEEAATKQLEQVEKIVQQAQLEMRALLLHLRPVALRNKSLSEGLEDLIIELQEKVYFDITYKIENITLGKAEEDHLFRIAQEALSNTLRHAKATDVELLFIERDHQAILRIQDNGLGFSVDDDKMSSYGLRNIAERAVEIGCTYKIVSVPNEGTIVEVKVPKIRGEQTND